MKGTTSRRGSFTLALAVGGFGVTGCSFLEDSKTGPVQIAATLDADRTLVAYFSSPETDSPDNMTVFIGYPWRYDLPMPMYSFPEQNNFAGKTCRPVSVHGGSQLSGTDTVITEKLTESMVIGNAFTISRSDMDSTESDVNAWLDDVTTA